MRQAAKIRVSVPTVTHTHADIKRRMEQGRLERSKAFHATLACLSRALQWLIGRA